MKNLTIAFMWNLNFFNMKNVCLLFVLLFIPLISCKTGNGGGVWGPPIVIRDTIYVDRPPITIRDTVYVEGPPITFKDTIYIELPPITIKDTVYIELPPVIVKDTVYIELPPVTIRDTVYIDVPIIVKDTIYIELPPVIKTDTIYIELPPITIRDTVYIETPPAIIRDTTYINNTEIIIGNSYMGPNLLLEPKEGLKRKFYSNFTGTLNDLRTKTTLIPSTEDVIVDFFATDPNNPSKQSSFADKYGQTIEGYIIPKETGRYIFSMISDDDAVLYLSTSDDPNGAVRISSLTTWAALENWRQYASQVSKEIQLVAGQRYYVKCYMRENAGGDWLKVGWITPSRSSNSTFEVITKEFLTY